MGCIMLVGIKGAVCDVHVFLFGHPDHSRIVQYRLHSLLQVQVCSLVVITKVHVILTLFQFDTPQLAPPVTTEQVDSIGRVL